MRYIDEFRDKELIHKLIRDIRRYSAREYKFMEVCGGHTMAIHKYGIPSMLPMNINLLSGPGCPVCVTDKNFIDRAVVYSRMKDVIITSYGDLLRVPGSYSSLEQEKAEGRDIRTVYSLLDALKIAKENPGRQVIFLGIGFETTAPATAVGILEAQKHNVSNFQVLSAHKLMPPAMDAIVEEGVRLDGYICPGHVSTITGKSIYEHIPEKYNLACVIAGFEPTDILQTILMLLRQIEEKRPAVEIQYKRAVKEEGNTKAQDYMDEVFTKRADYWRGLGKIRNSGLAIREEYRDFDAEYTIPVDVTSKQDDSACICGEILKGLKKPVDCRLFDKACTPVNPVGACMVSSEGACQAYYKYKRNEVN